MPTNKTESTIIRVTDIQILALIAIIILSIIFVLCLSFYITQIRYSLNPYRIVFVPTQVKRSKTAFEQIIHQYVPNSSKYSFVELGAGLAHVSSHMAKNYNWENITAIDSDWQLHQISRLLNRNSKINFVCGNIFQEQWPNNSVIYAYLSHTIMGRLYQEGRLQGNLVISATFQIKDAVPTKTYPVGGLQKNLYLYDFR